MFVSIAIPFFNAEKYLENAIKSVLSQSHTKWELILIDDGSIDNSLEIAKFYTKIDSRIRLIEDGENRNLPYRLNQAVEESVYDYIVRMDADDIMHPKRIELQLKKLLNDSNLNLVSSSYYVIDSKNNIVSKRIINKSNINISDLILGNYYICHPSVMGKKEWFLKNKYNEKYNRAEDYELWFRTCVNNELNIFIMSEPLLFYREDGSFSKNKQNLTYDSTFLILNDYIKKIGIKYFLLGFFRNLLKKIIINILFYNYLKEIILSRRRCMHKDECNIDSHEISILKSITNIDVKK